MGSPNARQKSIKFFTHFCGDIAVTVNGTSDVLFNWKLHMTVLNGDWVGSV